MAQTDSAGAPIEHQYVLISERSGYYLNVRTGEEVFMEAGEIWKVGATINPEGRYSNAFLDQMYLLMKTEFVGGHISVLAAEKLRLIGYAISHGNLPPGNCICK